ncbi:hypothetical protein VTN00DRAFT_4781 [Thermoascus crustaceus]|uniref:uncharacterized protein n=1 Tax=Thermoascus crustaceus TaxID=5088 RepID=UPI0037435892
MPFIAPDKDQKIRIYIDRGGTFCDCIDIMPGREDIVVKLLPVDTTNYDEALTG